MNRLQELVGRMKTQGLRMTPQRVAVVRALTASAEHPTAEEVHTRVRADFPMTSLATVYKTIATLKELGEVAEISLGGGSSHYDGRSALPHPHLICTRCHSVADANIPQYEDLAQAAARSSGYQIVSQRVDFFGICPRCQAEN